MQKARFLWVLVALCGAVRLAAAEPALQVSPSTLAAGSSRSVEIGLSGFEDETTVLRLFLDIDGDGTIDAEDYPVWSGVVRDDGARDRARARGRAKVDARAFGPTGYPAAAGTFLWQAGSRADRSATARFTVTTEPARRTVTGTVVDRTSLEPVAGVLVVAEAACGGELSTSAAFTGVDGTYEVALADEADCDRWNLSSFVPGYVGETVEVTSSAFTGMDLGVAAAARTVSGRIVHRDGPGRGPGVPGLPLRASSGSATTIAYTDENGHYTLGLSDGPWELHWPYEVLSRHEVVATAGPVAFSVRDSGSLPDLTVRGADARLSGTVRNEQGRPVSGRLVVFDRNGACGDECWHGAAVSGPDGRYTVGVVAGEDVEYTLSSPPLPGRIGVGLGCESVAAGETRTGLDLEHLAGTYSIGGRLAPGREEVAIVARAGETTCAPRIAMGTTGEDGMFHLPAVDGTWELSPADVGEGASVRVAGAGVSGVELVNMRPRLAPTLTPVAGAIGPAGGEVLVRGSGIPPAWQPSFSFDGIPAEVTAARPDLGEWVLRIPATLRAGRYRIGATWPGLGSSAPSTCFEVRAAEDRTCRLEGTTDRPEALVLAHDAAGRFVGAAVTDASGAFAIDASSAAHRITFVPAAGETFGWTTVDGSCGREVHHRFAPASRITGRVVTAEGDAIADAIVELRSGDGTPLARTRSGEHGRYVLAAPPGTVELYVDPPPGSVWSAGAGRTLHVDSDVDAGSTPLRRGHRFRGTVQDPAGRGRAAVITATRRTDGVWAGETRADGCDGSFALSLPPGDYSLRIEGEDFDGGANVEWVRVERDTDARFPFTVLDRGLGAPSGPEPRLRPEGSVLRARVGQPIELAGENLAGSRIDVLFNDGRGGLVEGVGTLADATRGLVLTRVPAGAVDGPVRLRVDGLESAPLRFDVGDGLFAAGGFAVAGRVAGPSGPAEGSLVRVYGLDPEQGSCGEDDVFLSGYALTDRDGAYGPIAHPGGAVTVVATGPDRSDLVGRSRSVSEPNERERIDFGLEQGFAVSVRALDGDTPIVGARFAGSVGDGSDQRVTDASGRAVLILPRGDARFSLDGPGHGRLVGKSWTGVLSRNLDLGSTELTRGRVVATPTVIDGTWRSVSRAVADSSGFATPSPRADAPDTIHYPTVEAPALGDIEGLVSAFGGEVPLGALLVRAYRDQGGFPGELAGETRTCPDGSYRLALPAGDHLLEFNGDGALSFVPEWYPNAWCPEQSQSVSVVGNGVASDLDAQLEAGGRVTGRAELDGAPLPGVAVCASSDSLGTCGICSAESDVSGEFSLSLPPAADWRLEASAAGLGTLCWSGDPQCSTFDPVAVAIDDEQSVAFEFGCGNGEQLFLDDVDPEATGTWSASGLWRTLLEPQCEPGAMSSGAAYHYGLADCTYATGSAHSGMLVSPTFGDMPGGAWLSYWQRRETDGNCFVTDRSSVWIWVNDSEPIRVWEECDNSGSWQVRHFDLTPFYAPGDEVRVGFEFDTIDGNDDLHLGWILDDIRIVACPPAPTDPPVGPGPASQIPCPRDSPDSDEDGFCDFIDNCPALHNGDQVDLDGDGDGDPCDPCPLDADNDADGDGICANQDNCPEAHNPDQADDDHDARGNACDPCPIDSDDDLDGDGVCPSVDNCPGVANADQADSNGDGVGDACDACGPGESDGDEDGFCDAQDNCPDLHNSDQADGDGDGIGDPCDPCPADPANDGDGDGVCADQDYCPDVADPDQANADGDVYGDACDPCPQDFDNDGDVDGVCGDVDNCPGIANADQADSNGDGVGDACDACGEGGIDFDQDGLCGVEDNCPHLHNSDQADGDGDGVGDPCDACPADPANDGDGDGVCGDQDNCPNVANGDQVDTDADGTGDACDPCPYDANDDGDADQLCADVDNCPTVANADQADADGDLAGDVCDPCPGDPANDVDEDGVCGDVDNCPHQHNADQVDEDGDGSGNACDPCLGDPDDLCGTNAIRVDFAPSYSDVPTGYVHADGSAFPGDGGFGWDGPVSSRDRAPAAGPPLSTFVYSAIPRTWRMDVDNGPWIVRVTIGDASYAQGPQRVTVNGVTAVDDVSTAAGEFHEVDVPVTVTEGRLTVEIGQGTANTALNVLVLSPGAP